LEEVIAALDMTNSTAEYLPLEKTWYHYTDEGASLPESSEESKTTPATDEPPAKDPLPQESSPQSPDASAEGGCEPANGCGAALRPAIPLTALLGGAALTRKKRGKKR
jgi:hypothetical protein